MNRNLVSFVKNFSRRWKVFDSKNHVDYGRQLSTFQANKQNVLRLLNLNNIQISTSIRSFSSEKIEKDFQAALAKSQKVVSEIDQATQNKLHALSKQGTIGPCSDEKPSMFDKSEKEKWQAWKSLGDMSPEEAKKQYIAIIDDHLKKASIDTEKEPSLVFEERDQVYWIKLNQPKQYNAMSQEMYLGVTDALGRAAQDPDIKFVVLTGNGKFYSSGNNLANLMKGLQEMDGDVNSLFKKTGDVLKGFVGAFIDFPKPIIAVVNGPAIGIMFTTLGLVDCVVASNTAYFTCPFSALGLVPEGCSTYTFPRIFGHSVASQLLYFNYKMSVEEAHQAGFVSRIIPHDRLYQEVDEWLYGEQGLVKTCYLRSLVNAKAMIRNEDTRLLLHAINVEESDGVITSFASEECMEALAKFFSRK